VKLAVRLGACIPEKPFNPEALAFPNGGKSKPMPVIVDVEPGCVICEVFVIVKVKVLVMELNSQTTVAVENWPESTPTIVMVSARTDVLAALKTNSAAKEKINFLNRDIEKPPCRARKIHPRSTGGTGSRCKKSCENCGALQVSNRCVCVAG
jgi:hypothetical protein